MKRMAEHMHEARDAVRRRRGLRRGLIVAGLVAVVVVGVLVLKLSRAVKLEDLGFRTLDENFTFQVANYPDAWRISSFSVSADGRWLAMRLDVDNLSPYLYDECLFFDLQRNQFVARIDGVAGDWRIEPLLHAEWTPDRFPVIRSTGESEPPGKLRQWVRRLLRLPASKGQEFALCRADVPAMKGRVLLSGRYQGRTYAVPNRNLTALYFWSLYYDQSRGSGSSPHVDRRIHDLRRLYGRSRPFPMENVNEIIGWLNDDRTLVVRSRDKSSTRPMERFELIDAFGERATREVSLGEPLERLQEQGELEAGKIGFRTNLSRILEDDRVCFGVVVSRPGRSRSDETHWSLWEVDLRTGAPSRTMELDWCRRYVESTSDIVLSPGGETVAAPVSTSTLLMSTLGTSMSVAVCRRGAAPRVLPFRVPRFYHIGAGLGDVYHGPSSPSPLRANMAFLDENTLIYRGPDNGLWRYDLRTSAPECLWSPQTPPVGVPPKGKAILAGHVIDTRGRPVADRLVQLVPKEKQKEGARRQEVPLASKTDLAGRFRIVDVPPGAHFLEIGVYAKRGLEITQRPDHDALVFGAGESIAGIDFVVEAPEDRGNLSIRVTDAASVTPVGTCCVKLPHVDVAGKGTAVLGRRMSETVLVPVLPHEEIKGQDGVFRIEGVSPGTATLEISADSYARRTVRVKVESGRTVDRTIAIEREALLHGYTTHNAAAKGYANVHAYPAGKGLDEKTWTRSDGLGYYEFKGLGGGDYLVEASIQFEGGGKPTVWLVDWTRASLESGKTTRVDFKFQGDAGIRGSFRCSDKDLSPFVLVQDSRRDAFFPEIERTRATSYRIPRGGSYEIQCLPPGTYTVIGHCRKREGDKYISVLETSKTVTLGDGEMGVVDFVFP